MSTVQRQHPRVRTPKVVVRITDVDKLRDYYLKDLSEGGLFIKADKLLPVGSEVNIELEPPGWNKPLALKGRVARLVNDEQAQKAKATGMGIKFEELSPETKEAIASIVSEFSAGQSELDRTKAQLHRAMTEVEAFKHQAAEKDRQLKEARQTIHELATAAEMVAELETSKLRMAELETAAGQVEPLSARIRELETKGAEHQTRAATLEHRVQELERAQAEARATIGRLEKEKADLDAARREDQVARQKLTESSGELVRKGDQWRADRERLQAELEAEKSARAALAATVEQLTAELAVEQSRGAAADTALQAHQAQLADELSRGAAKLEAARREHELSMAEAERRAKESADASTAELERVRAELRTLGEKLEAAEQRALDLEEQLASLPAVMAAPHRHDVDLSPPAVGEGANPGAFEGSSPAALGASSSGAFEESSPAAFEESSPAAFEESSPAVVEGSSPSALEGAGGRSEMSPERMSVANGASLGEAAEPDEWNGDDALAPGPLPNTSRPSPNPAALTWFNKPRAAGDRCLSEVDELTPAQPEALAEQVMTEVLDNPGRSASDLDQAEVALVASPAEVPGPTQRSEDSPVMSDFDELKLQGDAANGEPAPAPTGFEPVTPAKTDADVSLDQSWAAQFEVTETEPSVPSVPMLPADPASARDTVIRTVVLSAPPPKGNRITEFSEFHRRLVAGERLVRTPKFNLHMPSDPTEINVMGWLEDVDTLQALCHAANGRMGQDRIAQVAFAFYTRALVDLELA